MLVHQNEVEIKVLSGETGEVLHHWKDENAISDDFTVGGANGGRIYQHDQANAGGNPYLFLLPDGSNWTSGMWAAQGSVFDRLNPWAPYCTSINNFVDAGAEAFWKARPRLSSSPRTMSLPYRSQQESPDGGNCSSRGAHPDCLLTFSLRLWDSQLGRMTSTISSGAREASCFSARLFSFHKRWLCFQRQF